MDGLSKNPGITLSHQQDGNYKSDNNVNYSLSLEELRNVSMPEYKLKSDYASFFCPVCRVNGRHSVYRVVTLHVVQFVTFYDYTQYYLMFERC